MKHIRSQKSENKHDMILTDVGVLNWTSFTLQSIQINTILTLIKLQTASPLNTCLSLH